MDNLWDSISPDMREIVNEIVRAAVVYGYVRGFDSALITAEAGTESSRLRMGANDFRTRMARAEAEQFLMKVHVEEVTQPHVTSDEL